MDLVVALIAAAASITVAIIQKRQGKKIAETHKQVAENSHKNEKPTILDLIADLKSDQAETRAEVRQTNQLLLQHINWHLEKDEK